MIRVLICDDSAEARSLLRTLLSDHPEISIVGEAADGSEGIARAVELAPDVVVMDVLMPGVDGIEATRRIRELCPGTRIVAFTGVGDEDVARAVTEAGASACCTKGAPLWELERAIAGTSQPLLRLAALLARSLETGNVGQLVARELVDQTGAIFAAAYLAAPDIGLSLAGMAGPGVASSQPDRYAAAPGVALRAFSEAKPAYARGAELTELARMINAPCGQVVAAPLLAEGERLGALLTVMPASMLFELDDELVLAAADLASAAFANHRRVALTFAEARRDALTGLPNRRAFEEHLDQLLGEAAEHERSVSVVLLDLDDFKRVNDERGHGAGDRILRSIARLLLGDIATNAEVFRTGGNEFAIVLEGTAEAAELFAERLRSDTRRRLREDMALSLSAGVAGFPEHATTRDELVASSEAALRTAKMEGKDRVAVYDGERRSIFAARGGAGDPAESPGTKAPTEARLRILVVDDDEALRMLLRTTFEIVDIEVDEADDASTAAKRIEQRLPDVIVLDVLMPEIDGITFCRKLKADPATHDIPVVLLTGAEGTSEPEGREAGAEAFLRKPFSPLELLETVERLAGRLYEGPFHLMTEARPNEQLLLYAHDLRHLLEIERAQRLLLKEAWEETVGALARALESRDFGTGAHSERVRRYARELTRTLDSGLLADPGLEYGFVLHDVGKMGIPDTILLKPAVLTESERRVMETHTVIGEELLRNVPLVHGQGLRIIRSHHERWDGRGYPDRLAGEEIPVGARVFAVVDALDAMTSDRPYRKAGPWERAVREIEEESRRQFDPDVVEAFLACEPSLHQIFHDVKA